MIAQTLAQTKQIFYCLYMEVYQKQGAFSYILCCDLTRTEGDKTGLEHIRNRTH